MCVAASGIYRSTRCFGSFPPSRFTLHASRFTRSRFSASGPRCSRASQDAAHIADNSFLVEEAYNQEPGVVQHISTFSRPDGGERLGLQLHPGMAAPGDAAPAQLHRPGPPRRRQRHGPRRRPAQLPLPARRRWREPLAVAPRLTVFLPTGSEDEGRGAGSVGIQTNLPVSYVLSDALAAHGNAGLTLRASRPMWTQPRRQRHLAGSSLGELDGGDGVGERAGRRRFS